MKGEEGAWAGSRPGGPPAAAAGDTAGRATEAFEFAVSPREQLRTPVLTSVGT